MAPTLWGQILLRPHAAGLASPMSGSVGNWGEENGLTWHGPGAFPPPCQATPALEKPIGHSCCLLQKPQIPEGSRELGPSNQPTRGHFYWSAFVRARRNWFGVRNVFIFLSGRWNSINRTTKRNTEENYFAFAKILHGETKDKVRTPDFLSHFLK